MTIEEFSQIILQTFNGDSIESYQLVENGQTMSPLTLPGLHAWKWLTVENITLMLLITLIK